MPINVFFPDSVGIHDNYEVGVCVITILCLNCSGKSFVNPYPANMENTVT